ncbi:cbb3-type cytochrome c oxidase subunit II [uncultured Castellaniella sp.]|uniref:cbb3-type cytochrome c oxidase subunit II n=1 Tax=uncultured Castellaniella sp. TaxID=647907 RepID=UPI00261C1149|nr:cbb3-type cytochrome c oxidase subunit II [uncultured Castellaniella sp.]
MFKLLAIAGGSALLYAVWSFMMAILPGFELAAVPPGSGVDQLTLLQQHGRDVYVSEGCAYCHTQQVRPLPVDRIFGHPSAPGDFAYQTPELLGSERTGPDLTNVGQRQSSAIWQYIHLYDPRAVVPQSVMPPFRALFEVRDQAPAGEQAVPVPKSYAPAHGVVVPTADAKALVAYLLSLKQPALPKGESGSSAMAAPAAAQPAASSSPGGGATAAGAAVAFDAADGARLFASTCAACHGAQGAGVPGVFPPLAGNPVVNDKDPGEHVRVVLHGLHGRTIGGTAYAAQMPSFAAQLSDAQIADIIDHERTSWGNHAPAVTAGEVAAIRAKGEQP